MSNEKKCLIIHGVAGSSKENWFPWLKTELESLGWKVFVPDLPIADSPKVEEWNKALLEIGTELDEDSVIVGHSLGAPAAFNFLQTLKKKVNKIIVVAPVNPLMEWDELTKQIPGIDWNAVKSFANINFDWSKIESLASQIIIYYSSDDPYISPESVNYYRENLKNSEFILIEAKGHLGKSLINGFPELLQKIIL